MIANNKGKVFVADGSGRDAGSIVEVLWTTSRLSVQENFPSAQGNLHYVDLEWRGIAPITVEAFRNEENTAFLSWLVPVNPAGDIWTRTRCYNTQLDQPGVRFAVQIKNFDGAIFNDQSREMEIRNIIIKTRPFSRRRNPAAI
jgi:hypothetical protein